MKDDGRRCFFGLKSVIRIFYDKRYVFEGTGNSIWLVEVIWLIWELIVASRSKIFVFRILDKNWFM